LYIRIIMSTLELVELFEKLPLEKQKAVEEFVHTLSVETEKKVEEQPSDEPPKKLKREFGGLKGFVKYMADDFDAPLDDFKEYM
jgi:hypothetical protein